MNEKTLKFENIRFNKKEFDLGLINVDKIVVCMFLSCHVRVFRVNPHSIVA